MSDLVLLESQYRLLKKWRAQSLLACPQWNKWEGQACVRQMYLGNFQMWAQTEWQGWYWEYLARQDTSLGNIFNLFPVKSKGPSLGPAGFDVSDKSGHPWDLKTHGSDKGTLLLNDEATMRAAIAKHGCIGFLVLCGETSRTAAMTDWHRAFRVAGGKKSHMRHATKFSRKLPENFNITKILVLEIDAGAVPHLKYFQKDFVNSNGLPRNSKFCLPESLLVPGSPIKYGWL